MVKIQMRLCLVILCLTVFIERKWVHCHMSHDPRHGNVQMGVPDDKCDNGRDGIDVDLSQNYLKDCDSPRSIDVPGRTQSRTPIEYCTGTLYAPLHKCLNSKIYYNEPIPLSGSHRPLWPVYGEYEYCPPQRWVHSLEHGAAVFLYHPCVDQTQLKIFKNLAKACLRKHIITPYNLTEGMPLAIVTWGCLLTFDRIDTNLKKAVHFIKRTAMQAQERSVIGDGTYDEDLYERSPERFLPNGKVNNDLDICPLATLNKYLFKNLAAFGN